MKQAKTIAALTDEVFRQQESKRDFILKTNYLEVVPDPNGNRLLVPTQSEVLSFGISNNGHRQLANFCKIPMQYYNTIVGHPELHAKNVKYWLDYYSDRRLIRCLDGNVRALLSDRYRRLDNYDIIQLVIPIIQDFAEIDSCEITETKLYIKAINYRAKSEVRPGDVVSSGIIIMNSEVGAGSLQIQPLLYRLVCSNGMVVDAMKKRKYHVGREMEDIFQTDTQIAEDRAFWFKFRDTVRYCISETALHKMVDMVSQSTKIQIQDPQHAVEITGKQYGLTESEREQILKELFVGNDPTLWGLANAVTRVAQTVESYDRSVELEAIGWDIATKN